MATSLPAPRAQSPLVRRLVSVLGACAVVACLVWVYPTQYAYYGDYRSGLIRVHRITQQAHLLTRTGWVVLEPSALPSVGTATDTGNPFVPLARRYRELERQHADSIAAAQRASAAAR